MERAFPNCDVVSRSHGQCPAESHAVLSCQWLVLSSRSSAPGTAAAAVASEELGCCQIQPRPYSETERRNRTHVVNLLTQNHLFGTNKAQEAPSASRNYSVNTHPLWL